jgi:NADPH2:quinone reductase
VRAAVYREFGPVEVLHVEDLPEPHPAPGEVRVRVAVSSVNPTDWKVRSGRPGAVMEFDYVVPNQDGAGVVDEVGEGVDPSRIGQRVWIYFAQAGRQHGTAAQWTCLPEKRAVPLPDPVSLDLGASLGVPALTARHALMCDGPIAGSTVLVSGGAGAVGHFAIELARRAGARVVTTVSGDEKAQMARAAGADTVVVYTREDAAEAIRAVAPGGVERIVEVAPSNLSLDSKVLAAHGTIVMYASSERDPTLPVRPLMELNATVRAMFLYGVCGEDLDSAVSDVSAALTEGALSELPYHRFSLDQIADAHRAVQDGAVGKVLVDIGE